MNTSYSALLTVGLQLNGSSWQSQSLTCPTAANLTKTTTKSHRGVCFPTVFVKKVNEKCMLTIMCFSGCIPRPVVFTAADDEFGRCLSRMFLPLVLMNCPWGSADQVLWLLSKARIKCPGKRWICLRLERYQSFSVCLFCLPFKGKWGETQWAFLT
jgi:hypothetical protein